MRSFQTTTHMGTYSLLAGFLNTFQDVKLEHFWDVFTGLTCGELISMLLPFLIGLWAILHDEKRGYNVGRATTRDYTIDRTISRQDNDL